MAGNAVEMPSVIAWSPASDASWLAGPTPERAQMSQRRWPMIELDSSFGCSPHLPGSHNPLILQGSIQIQCP
jgi:hypothetical protein